MQAEFQRRENQVKRRRRKQEITIFSTSARARVFVVLKIAIKKLLGSKLLEKLLEAMKVDLVLEGSLSRVIGFGIHHLKFYKKRRVLLGFPLKRRVLSLAYSLHLVFSCLIILDDRRHNNNQVKEEANRVK